MNLCLGFILVFLAGTRGFHLQVLHTSWPSLFTEQLTTRLSLLNPLNQAIFLSCAYLAFVLYLSGLRHHGKLRRYERAFKSVGIRNALGACPRVIDYKQVTKARTRIRLHVDGISPAEITKQGGALETSLGQFIEEVTRGSSPNLVDLRLTSKRISTKVLYKEAVAFLKTPYSFIVGDSLGGILTEDITGLPHMLVAGSTGSGKSVFLRQLLMGLLEASPSLQVYLLDLKRGLELKDFTLCPNVEMIKHMPDALNLLRRVRTEMHRRFEILEASNHNRIDPERDKLDRIVVCIDEASVLYGTGRTNPVEKKLAEEASEVTDEIAKLSRAAGIHLILATQKVTKETINTHIQENLEGRMCFEVNSLQGSNLVLGNGAAKELPHIPGRGIWKVGARLVDVQSPFIESDEIKARCKVIAEEFKRGARTMKQKMFGQLKRERAETDASELITD